MSSIGHIIDPPLGKQGEVSCTNNDCLSYGTSINDIDTHYSFNVDILSVSHGERSFEKNGKIIIGHEHELIREFLFLLEYKEPRFLFIAARMKCGCNQML